MYSIDKNDLTDYNSCSNISRKSTESELEIENSSFTIIKLCKKTILNALEKKKKIQKIKKKCKNKNRVVFKINNFDQKYFCSKKNNIKKKKFSKEKKKSVKIKINNFDENFFRSNNEIFLKRKISFISNKKKMSFDIFPTKNSKILNSQNYHFLQNHKYDNDIDSDTETVKNGIWKNFTSLQDKIQKLRDC